MNEVRKERTKDVIKRLFDGWTAIDIIELLEELAEEMKKIAAQSAQRIRDERNN